MIATTAESAKTATNSIAPPFTISRTKSEGRMQGESEKKQEIYFRANQAFRLTGERAKRIAYITVRNV
jgi:hypothetical protein